jgi:hypothetical protein
MGIRSEDVKASTLNKILGDMSLDEVRKAINSYRLRRETRRLSLMGTVLFEKDGLQLKRFYGGVERGVCYAICKDDSTIELEIDEMRDIVQNLDFMIYVLPKSRRRD